MVSISAKSPGPRSKRVVVVVYPGVTLLDAAGPAQAFASANQAFTRAGQQIAYDLLLASPAGGAVETDTGITVGTVSLRQASAKPIDTLIIAGGVGVFDLLEERKLIKWVIAQHRNCRRLATTCMGAFVTAEAGLLEGQSVTTHWRYTEDLQQRYPKVQVKRDPLFVRNGKMWSAAGVTSGIDLALAMIEEDHGHEIAMQVAQALVVFLKRPGGQAQFSNVLIAQKEDDDGMFSKLHAWIASNLQGALDVDSLAKRAGMSARTFARLYKGRIGTTPARSVEIMRVDAAQRLLEQGEMPLARIATKTGLADEQRLRRAFLRHVGISPTDYRRKFGANAH